MSSRIQITNQFTRLYKDKSKGPSYLVDRIDDLIIQLKLSDDPKSLGEMKKGYLDGLYSIRINKDSRILYKVVEKDGIRTVELLRVCSHKNVYGKDRSPKRKSEPIRPPRFRGAKS